MLARSLGRLSAQAVSYIGPQPMSVAQATLGIGACRLSRGFFSRGGVLVSASIVTSRIFSPPLPCLLVNLAPYKLSVVSERGYWALERLLPPDASMPRHRLWPAQQHCRHIGTLAQDLAHPEAANIDQEFDRCDQQGI